MAQFAGYGFNKSHSAAYALIAYQTAYLKTHYPVQFMSSLLTCEMGNTDKVVKYLNECSEMGIQILPPNLNASDLNFRASNGEIVFGLAAIKNVGEAAIQSIMGIRNKLRSFSSIFEFCENVDLRVVNKRVLESLIKAGVFDSIHKSRRSLMSVLESALERGQKANRDRLSGQKGLFGEQPPGDKTDQIPFIGDWSDQEQWGYEKECLGFYVSGHPLQKYKQEFRKLQLTKIDQLGELVVGRKTSLGGMVTSIRKIQTRKGATMATFYLEDLTGSIEVVVFPKAYESCNELLIDSDHPIFVRGHCEVDGREVTRVIASQVLKLDSIWKEGFQKLLLTIPLPLIDTDSLKNLQELIKTYSGNCPIEFEIFKKSTFRIRLIPNQTIGIASVPAFIEGYERLFGENSVTLYTKEKY